MFVCSYVLFCSLETRFGKVKGRKSFVVVPVIMCKFTLACLAVVSVSYEPSGASTKDARALGKKKQNSRSGGEGRGRKGNACR